MVAIFIASGAAAEGLPDVAASEARSWSIQAGLGFMVDPDAFLLGLEADYRIGSCFSLGPSIELGIDDDFTVVSPTAHLRYSFDMRGVSESLRPLRPFVQAGAGLTWIHLDRPNFSDNDRNDVGFLANAGFGVDYDLTRHLALGSRMLFNFMPVNAFGENFYYSWQVATLRLRF
jgi:hypothetical protein